MRYVAFLRGINVGGHKALKMADLRAAFERLGFTDVRTVQASGNVLFDAAGDASPVMRLEDGLKAAFGYPIGVTVRSLAAVAGIVESNPFADVPQTHETRLYVTFLPRPAGEVTDISPQPGAQGTVSALPPGLRMVEVTGGEVLTAITLSPEWGTTDLMAWLEKEYGPGITTRNWNTVIKIAGG